MKNKKKNILLLSISILLLCSLAFGIYKYIQHKEYVFASPYDVLISDIYHNSVTISWKTDTYTPSYIKLGENEKLWGNEEKVKSHRIKISGLKELSSYKFSITDGKKEWNISKSNTFDLERFVLNEFSFSTTEFKNEISLPSVEELSVQPYELVYLVLKNGEQYSTVRSFTANRYGGIAINTDMFDFDNNEYEILNIKYETSQKISSKGLVSSIYAADSPINCNKNAPSQSIDGKSREEFADLATRWVGGAGKHYALECYNDVVLRAKNAGVDPAFVLTIWLHESGASNYTKFPGVQDFGINFGGVPSENFEKQITAFLNLKHDATCSNLPCYWEAWGNMYRTGSCNEGNAARRQVGIDYYKQIERQYGYVTNGRSLPNHPLIAKQNQNTGCSATPSPSPSPSPSPTPSPAPNTSGLCCALKLDNQEKFQGDFEDNTGTKTCDQIWKIGRNVYDGKIQYSVAIPNKSRQSCETKYEGACFLRDGQYKWLPKILGKDSLQGVSTYAQCQSKNSTSLYKISLHKGVNFVGFDFTPSYELATMLASDLIKSNSNILLVGNFNEYEWKDLIKQSQSIPFAGNDFELKQNKGYLIITDKDITLELSGWKDDSLQYDKYTTGWNLVGGTHYTKSSVASSLVDTLAQSNILVDTVAVWNTQTAMFNYRRKESTQIYGEDFSLKENEGIFLYFPIQQ